MVAQFEIGHHGAKSAKSAKMLSSEPSVFGDGFKRGGVAVTVCLWARGWLLRAIVQTHVLHFLAQFNGEVKELFDGNESEGAMGQLIVDVLSEPGEAVPFFFARGDDFFF